MRTIGFYSFKGGVGRSNLIMNLAYYLAWTQGKQVGILDLDLEAPGLSVSKPLQVAEGEKYPDKGLYDYLDAASKELRRLKKVSESAQKQPLMPDDPNAQPVKIPNLKELFYRTKMAKGAQGAVYLWPALCPPTLMERIPDASMRRTTSIQANLLAEKYQGNNGTPKTKIGEWLFQDMRSQIGEIEVFEGPYDRGDIREHGKTSLDYLLVDLRTGLTFVSDLAIGSLFSELVIVCGLNDQNLLGLSSALHSMDQLLQNRPGKPIPVLPVFSPIPTDEIKAVRGKLIKARKQLEKLVADLESSRLKLDVTGPARSKLLFPEKTAANCFRIHYCGYLATEEVVLIEQFPEVQAADDLRTVCGHISKEIQSRLEESKKEVNALLPKQIPETPKETAPSEPSPQAETKQPEVPDPEGWQWVEDYFKKPLSWRWPIQAFCMEGADPAMIDEKLVGPFDNKDFGEQLNSGLARSVSLNRDEKRKAILTWNNLSNRQFLELDRIFEEEREKFASLGKEYIRIIGKLVCEFSYNWIMLLKELGARLLVEKEMLHRIVQGQASSVPIPAPFLLLGFIQGTSNNHIAIEALRHLFSDIECPVEVQWEALKATGNRFSDAAKSLGEEIGTWVNQWLNMEPAAYPLDQASFWYSLGNLLQDHLSRYEEAEKVYRKSIELDSQNAYPWNGLGNLLAQHTEKYKEAEEAYRKSIEIDSNLVYPWNGLGYLFENHLERYDEAEEAYRKSIEIDPKQGDPWFYIGRLLAEHTTRYIEAEEAYRKCIEINPKNAHTWNRLGNLLKNHLDRYEEAEEAYRKCIEIDPKNAYSWNGLGNLFQDHLGRYEEAEEAYRKSIEIDPKNAYSWNGLGNLFQDHLGRYEEAEEAYRKSIEVDPTFAYPWNGLGTLLQDHLGRYEEAEEAYRKSIEVDPTFAYPWNGLGTLLQDHLGRYEEAEEAYRKSIEIDPTFISPWNGLGNLLQDHLGRYKEAVEKYEKAIELGGISRAYIFYNYYRLLKVTDASPEHITDHIERIKKWIENEPELSRIEKLGFMHAAVFCLAGHRESASKVLDHLSTKPGLSLEDKLWHWVLSAVTQRSVREFALDSIDVSELTSNQLEDIAHLMYVFEQDIHSEDLDTLNAWIEKTLRNHVPKAGDRNLAPNAINPYLKRLGIPFEVPHDR